MPVEWERKSWGPGEGGWPSFCPDCGRTEVKCDATVGRDLAMMCPGRARRALGMDERSGDGRR